MNGTIESNLSGGAQCPDFETLSCFVDGEVDGGEAAALAVHVRRCAHCAALAARLHAGFAPDAGRRDGGRRGAQCAGDESLVAYAAGSLAGTERAVLAAHVEECNACTAGLAGLSVRLAAAEGMERAVPPEVRRRADAALAAEVAQMAPRPQPRESTVVRRFQRWREALRVPMLVPVALAAGALFVLALQPGWMDPGGGEERSRAAAPSAARLRVTAVEAAVHSRPSMRSDVVGTVRRGAVMEVTGEERDWYSVRLDGSGMGWVERDAFE